MPTLGLNWISALIIGTVFGVLHLGNGRKYSFAIWYILFLQYFFFACAYQKNVNVLLTW
jgi:membrane protease YdiL (CAAX protease family)